jgi:hypothetical protein
MHGATLKIINTKFGEMKRKPVRVIGSCNGSEPGFSHLASSTSQYLMNIACETIQ